MKTEAPPVPAPTVSDREITLQNRLHPGHRYRAGHGTSAAPQMARTTREPSPSTSEGMLK
jgi:hypothetical protein